MKRMIDAKKFLDKLLYMGYMDEQKSEVEEVANNMTEDAYTKDEVITMLTELQTEFEEGKYNIENFHYDKLQIASGFNSGIADCIESIQEKINRLKGNENGNNN